MSRQTESHDGTNVQGLPPLLPWWRRYYGDSCYGDINKVAVSREVGGAYIVIDQTWPVKLNS